MLTVYLIVMAVIGFIAALMLIVGIGVAGMCLAEGRMTKRDRKEIQGFFKGNLLILVAAPLWPLVLPYLLFTLFWHIFAEDDRDHKFPHPWSKPKVDTEREYW